MIEPFKYLIQPVAVERDENGRVVREVPAETIAVYSADQALLAVSEFEHQLAQLTKEQGMPVDEVRILNITCDNPACPGNELDPAERTGWTFVNTEVYGEATQQHVFCCAECASTIGTALAADEVADASE